MEFENISRYVCQRSIYRMVRFERLFAFLNRWLPRIDHISQLKAPPLVVNKTAAFYGDLALVHSPRLGKNEPAHMLQEASIIDVYNWRKETYEFSFYIHNTENGSVKKFHLYDKWLVALMGKTISVYQLNPAFFAPPSFKTK